MTLISLALGFCTIAAVIVLLASFFHLDGLIRAGYQNHHDKWLADGRPYFLRAPERLGLFSHISWMRVSWLWLFHTPDWVNSSPEHIRRLKLLRRCVLTWNLTVAILAISFIYIASTQQP